MAAIGTETALGLLADAEELATLRQRLNDPWFGQQWRAFVDHVSSDEQAAQCDDLALIAAVTQAPSWQTKAMNAALRVAHLPATAWIHPEAGCMTLTGMENARKLAISIDWLWPVLNRDQREAMLSALIAHGVENRTRAPEGYRTEDDKGRLLLLRRMDVEDEFCLHPLDEQVNNWDLWFSASLFMAASLAERAFLSEHGGDEPMLIWGHYHDVGYELTPERIEHWKAVAQERIETALANQVGPDGDYAEGVNYGAYGGEALVLCLTLLDRLAGVNHFCGGVMKLPDWLRDQVVDDPEFGVFNVNDAKSDWRPPLAVFAIIAKQSRKPQHAGYVREALQRVTPNAFSILALDPTIDVVPHTPPSFSVYQHLGQVIWRAGGRQGLVLAAQSGAHGGAHQHRDRGAFWLAALGERLLVDTGDCRYAANPYPGFLDTAAHNAVLIDGEGQIGDNNAPTAGRLLSYSVDNGMMQACFDASDCYANVSSYERHIEATDWYVKVTDIAPGAASFTWMAQGYNVDGASEWQIAGGHAQLVRPNVVLHIFFDCDPTSTAIAPRPMEIEPAGILRLAVTCEQERVTVILIPAKPGTPVTREGNAICVNEQTISF